MSEDKCCRTCLKSDLLNPIFRDKNQAERYSEVIAETTGLKIQINDGLSQVMCKPCIKFINSAIEFRRRALCSESILMKRLKLSHIHSPIKQDAKTVVQVKIPSLKSISPQINKMFTIRPANSNSEGLNLEIENEKKMAVIKKIKEEIECKMCKRILTSRLSMKNHLKMHTGFDVICEHCGKKFANKLVMLMHCRAKHGYEKVDKCSFCDYKGCSLRQVKVHERIHTGERPFACDDCGARFHRRETHKQHLATHRTENTVQCDVCAAEFRSKHLLNCHRHRVHTNKHYSHICYVCRNLFASKKNVVKHMRGVHAILKPDTKKIERIWKQHPQ